MVIDISLIDSGSLNRFIPIRLSLVLCPLSIYTLILDSNECYQSRLQLYALPNRRQSMFQHL